MSGPMPTHTEVFVDDGGGEENEVPGLMAAACCVRLRAKMLWLMLRPPCRKS
jgi:hypothetical protein